MVNRNPVDFPPPVFSNTFIWLPMSREIVRSSE